MNDPHNSDPEFPTRKKEFQLSSEDKSQNVARSEHDSTPKKGPTGDEDPKRDSPSNLLPNIKGFNIERSRYQHYGHKSSMNAQSLDRIINEDKNIPSSITDIKKIEEEKEGEDAAAIDKEMKDDSDKLSLKSEKSEKSFKSERLGSGSERSGSGSERSRSGSDSNFKLVIDESMGKLLGLPHDKETSWPYSNETLSELLRFKTEQERTKQEEIRNEFASTSLQLLTLAKSMNIGTDLIPHLFNSSLIDLQKNLNTLRSNPHELMSSIHDNHRKRRFSDSVRPHHGSSSLAPHEIPLQSQSALVSPMRSPTRLPSSTHRRGRSDDNEQVATVSNIHSPSSAVNPSYSEPYSSQQHSPNQMTQVPPPLPPHGAGATPGMYPVYYHQPPPPPPHSVQTPSSETQSGLGSPYQQKYQVLYHHPPPPPPQASGSQQQLHHQSSQGGQPQPYSGHYVPQRQYHYYIASPPNQPASGVGHGQYSSSSMIPPIGQPQHGAFAAPETRESDDPSPSYKKQKSVSTGRSSTGSINFMISTPKNPPARKYNNPSKDK